MKILDFRQIEETAKTKKGKIVVPMAHNEEALEAIKMGMDEGWIEGGILIGDLAKIKEIAVSIQLNLQNFDLVEIIDPNTAATEAVKMLVESKMDFLLKGVLDSKIYLKSILSKDYNIVPEGRLLCHAAIMQIPGYHKLLGVSDVAININPDVNEKIRVIDNMVDIFHKLGVEKPKVALVCPVEKVNPKIQSTVDAAAIVEHFKDSTDRIVGGPFDLYISVSKHAAAEKGVQGDVCGDADILIFPNLDSANPVYKTMNQFIPDIRSAAIVAGASIPVILTSRADSADTKKLSIALSAFLAKQ
ncbi:MAG: phosphate butyryltransferase [Firmicutes bacterium]|nr:phosphate butyryltransferase [Bacillota bacterium]